MILMMKTMSLTLTPIPMMTKNGLQALMQLAKHPIPMVHKTPMMVKVTVHTLQELLLEPVILAESTLVQPLVHF